MAAQFPLTRRVHYFSFVLLVSIGVQRLEVFHVHILALYNVLVLNFLTAGIGAPQVVSAGASPLCSLPTCLKLSRYDGSHIL